MIYVNRFSLKRYFISSDKQTIIIIRNIIVKKHACTHETIINIV